ncbi:unnamed protein product [Lampetra fluviatilis]
MLLASGFREGSPCFKVKRGSHGPNSAQIKIAARARRLGAAHHSDDLRVKRAAASRAQAREGERERRQSGRHGTTASTTGGDPRAATPRDTADRERWLLH